MFDKTMLPDYICRPSYLERLRPYIDTPLIKVLTGQRRVGKSYILFQLIAELLERFPAEAIIYINKELHEFNSIRSGEDLYGYIKSRLPANGPAYVFIDEIQDIAGFEHALRSLLASRSCDMYCTGSNAHLLSGELATYLAGRHEECLRVHLVPRCGGQGKNQERQFLGIPGGISGRQCRQSYVSQQHQQIP
ncbi:MAG: AAA family ATPase [Chlorobium sp.]|nr:AAA family ATPase [Chlorobium sp.]